MADIQNQLRKTFGSLKALANAPAKRTITRLRTLSSQDVPAFVSPEARQAKNRRWRLVYIALAAVAAGACLVVVCSALIGARHLETGIAQLAGGHPREALLELDACIACNRSLTVAYQYRAMANAALRNDAQALADLDRVLEDQPDNVDSLIARAGLYVINQEYGRAASDCQHALRLQPDRAEVYRLQAICALKQGKFDRAVSDCRAYLALAGDNIDDRAPVLCTMGDALAKSGHADDALKEYSRAIALRPSADLYLKRAQLLSARHKSSAAFDDCSKALRLSPTAAAFQVRAGCCENMGKLGAAAKDIDAAIKLDPHDFVLYRQRARLAMARQDWAQAVADLKKVMESEPENHSVSEELVAASKHMPSIKAMVKAGNIDSAKAGAATPFAAVDLRKNIAAWLNLVRSQPNNLDARLNLARGLLSNGQAGDAVDQFSVVSSARGLGPDDLLSYARALHDSGNLSKAASRFEDYVYVRPADIQARLALIATYKESGQNEKALLAARQAELRVNNPAQQYQLQQTIRQLDPSQRARARHIDGQPPDR